MYGALLRVHGEPHCIGAERHSSPLSCDRMTEGNSTWLLRIQNEHKTQMEKRIAMDAWGESKGNNEREGWRQTDRRETSK